jgi:hypothetical protein
VREEQVGETKNTHASKKRSEEERAIKLKEEKMTNHSPLEASSQGPERTVRVLQHTAS